MRVREREAQDKLRSCHSRRAGQRQALGLAHFLHFCEKIRWRNSPSRTRTALRPPLRLLPNPRPLRLLPQPRLRPNRPAASPSWTRMPRRKLPRLPRPPSRPRLQFQSRPRYLLRLRVQRRLQLPRLKRLLLSRRRPGRAQAPCLRLRVRLRAARRERRESTQFPRRPARPQLSVRLKFQLFLKRLRLLFSERLKPRRRLRLRRLRLKYLRGRTRQPEAAIIPCAMRLVRRLRLPIAGRRQAWWAGRFQMWQGSARPRLLCPTRPRTRLRMRLPRLKLPRFKRLLHLKLQRLPSPRRRGRRRLSRLRLSERLRLLLFLPPCTRLRRAWPLQAPSRRT